MGPGTQPCRDRVEVPPLEEDPVSATTSEPEAWVNRTTIPWLSASWLAAFNCRAPLVAAGPLLPLMMQSLHLSGTVSGLLTGLPLLMMAALSLPGGILGDRFGPRAVIIAAQVGIAAAGALRAFSAGGPMLLVLTACLGAAIGLSQPALAQVAQRVSRTHASEATAVYSSGLMMGSLAATLLSVPWLLPWLGGWRNVLVAWGVPGIAAAILWMVIRLPREPHQIQAPAAPRGFVRLADYPGTVPLIVTFGAQSMIFYGLITWISTYYTTRGWTLTEASWPAVLLSLGSLMGALLVPVLIRRGGGLRRPMLWAGLATVGSVGGILWWPAAGEFWALAAGTATAVAFALGLAAPALLARPGETGRLAGTVMAAGYAATVIGPLAVGALRDLTGHFTPGFMVLLAAAALIVIGARGLPLTPRESSPAA
jgi:CP family cyanate transporter-like MFS transporter